MVSTVPRNFTIARGFYVFVHHLVHFNKYAALFFREQNNTQGSVNSQQQVFFVHHHFLPTCVELLSYINLLPWWRSKARALRPLPDHVYVDGHVQYDEMLGCGSSKVVYRGFDEVRGIEVAWNKEKLACKDMHEEGFNRLEEEVRILKNIRHKNIIKIYASWIDKDTQVVNFITEIFNSGTLRRCA